MNSLLSNKTSGLICHRRTVSRLQKHHRSPPPPKKKKKKKNGKKKKLGGGFLISK